MGKQTFLKVRKSQIRKWNYRKFKNLPARKSENSKFPQNTAQLCLQAVRNSQKCLLLLFVLIWIIVFADLRKFYVRKKAYVRKSQIFKLQIRKSQIRETTVKDWALKSQIRKFAAFAEGP